jgi:hypothetical protein
MDSPNVSEAFWLIQVTVTNGTRLDMRKTIKYFHRNFIRFPLIFFFDDEIWVPLTSCSYQSQGGHAVPNSFGYCGIFEYYNRHETKQFGLVTLSPHTFLQVHHLKSNCIEKSI